MSKTMQDAASPFPEESYYREQQHEEIPHMIRTVSELTPYAVMSESFHGDAMDTSESLLPPLVPSPVTNFRSFSFLSNADEHDEHSQHLQIFQGPSRRENTSRISNFESMPPNMVPIDQPTGSDILFGRGGLTNHHPGNKRFRDIVSLHKDEYAEASKVLKPFVARKIVKAIRNANPPGRFLMKNNYDNKWYDVGDRRAAEKASQALREKSQDEKKNKTVDSIDDEHVHVEQSMHPLPPPDLNQFSGERRSENIFHVTVNQSLPLLEEAHSSFALNGAHEAPQGLSFYAISPFDPRFSDTPSSNKTSTEVRAAHLDDMITHNQQLQEQQQRSIPSSSMGLTDTNGNIIVTEHDILCGRGGATNHHKGNKRFRDVVALHRQDYIRASKTQKPDVSRTIVRAIRSSEPPGRFLKKDDDGFWYDIGDQRAAEKVSQALREKSQDDKAELSDTRMLGNDGTTGPFNEQERAEFHGSTYNMLDPGVYPLNNSSDSDRLAIITTNSNSQPISPITFSHVNFDQGCLTEEKIHAI